ncbi:MAG: pyridoxamine 5'-phosphate oxidase [Myxococcota bacterium]
MLLTPEDAGGRGLPWACLEAWLADAVAAGEPEPTAMALATATADGAPSVRLVLYKGHDEAGLRFFTGYGSRKGRELGENPRAAAVFYWPHLARQVRVEGRVGRVSEAESDAYFASRTRESQLAAVASPQSEPLASRGELEARFAAAQRRFAGGEVARPAAWGGFRLEPERWEFWVGGSHRLHDRWEMRREAGGWVTARLGP